MKKNHNSVKKILGIFLFGLICFPALSQTITTICGTGTAGYSGDNGPAVNAQINNIYCQMCTDNAGNLYIADGANNRIRMISASTGSITTIAGTGAYSFSGDGGTALNATFRNPEGVAIDNSGNIYISDYGNNRIRMIAPSGTITTICGTGVASSTGDGGLASAATINSPGHIWVDPAGSVFITEYYGNRVRKIASTGSITTVIGNGTNTNTGDGGLASAATISGPWEIVGDKTGNIYVATYQGSYIRKISTTGTVTSIAGINGSPGYSGDNGPAVSAQLGSVTGLGINEAGDIFLADSANHRIRRVNVSGIITTVAGNGTMGFSGDGGAATSAQIQSPNGSLAFFGCALYFNDTGNSRIRKVQGIAPVITAVSSATNFICVGQTATLTASGGSYYNWSTGGNTSSIAVSPTVTSSYSVVGTATNGCQNSAVISQSVSPCTGIDNTGKSSQNSDILIYPNPNNGLIFVDVFNNDFVSQKTELIIVTAMGQVIKREVLIDKQHKVELSGIENGIYFIQLLQNDKTIVCKKFMKQD